MYTNWIFVFRGVNSNWGNLRTQLLSIIAAYTHALSGQVVQASLPFNAATIILISP